MRRIVLAGIAGLAFLSTAGVAVSNVLLSLETTSNLSLRASAIAAAALQGTLLIILSWFTSTLLFAKIRELSKSYCDIAFGLGITASLVSFAASVLPLAWLDKSTIQQAPVPMTRQSFIIGASVVLGVALISQIAFMAIHFRSSKSPARGGVQNYLNKDVGAWSPSSYVKSIRYSQTMPRASESEDKSSIQLQDSPPSMRSKFNVPGALKVSIPQVIRSTSSRTRLLPTQETRRPLSLDSYTYASSVQESFDNWDTSSVDFHNRQVVMEVASSPISPLSRVHNLDTIAASPRVSRAQSPGKALDLQAPRIPQRSRSYSPAAVRRPKVDTAPHSPSELHIHPLFRSDSPVSPPILSPGTSVVASPDAGQILQNRKSLRQLQFSKSCETMSSIRTSQTAPQERKMTPPVPDWVLNSARGPPLPRKSEERKMSSQQADARAK